jgi:hypothetical protein
MQPLLLAEPLIQLRSMHDAGHIEPNETRGIGSVTRRNCQRHVDAAHGADQNANGINLAQGAMQRTHATDVHPGPLERPVRMLVQIRFCFINSYKIMSYSRYLL